ncbi:MAG: PQQ-binding-like beta-propeller repeat protein [Candidatus Marinimicrobia bacterium]|nr:PQQ-binding-like beta-propeller repeat protein [Candidatus Neomarinimicrobiota bacterium]
MILIHLMTSLMLLAMLSCPGSIKVTNISTINKDSDWTQLGGNPEHNGKAFNEVKPPLTQLWRSSVDHAPNGNLTAAQGKIFVATMGGKVVALDHETGISLGSLNLEKSIGKGIAIDGIHGYFGRVGGDETLFGYELRNGIYVWQKKIGPVESMPLVVGELLYVTTANGELFCLDAETGTVKWSFKSGKPFHSTPTKSEGLIYAANDSGYVYALYASSGKLKWKYLTAAPVFSSPIVHGADLFTANLSGRIYSLDKITGEINWEFSGEGSFYSMASIGNDALFIASGSGILYKIGLSQGNLIWESDLSAPVSEGLLVSGNYIYVGSLNHNLYCLSAETGEIVWQEKLDGRVRTAPIEHAGKIFIGAEDKYVYAYSNLVQVDE